MATVDKQTEHPFNRFRIPTQEMASKASTDQHVKLCLTKRRPETTCSNAKVSP